MNQAKLLPEALLEGLEAPLADQQAKFPDRMLAEVPVVVSSSYSDCKLIIAEGS